MSELIKRMKEWESQESWCVKYEVLSDWDVESVEKEWEKFSDIMKECTNGICGMRRVGGQGRKRSEWWNEEVGVEVAEEASI